MEKKLEIGSGSFKRPGYDTLDKEASYQPTYCADMGVIPWPVPSETYDEVLGIHVIEHIRSGVVDGVFREILRILKPGGVLKLHVPDGLLLAKAYIQLPGRRNQINMAIYGCEAESDPAFAHKFLYDAPMLMEAFTRNGFVDVSEFTGSVSDRHDEAWSWMGGMISLKVRGRRRRVIPTLGIACLNRGDLLLRCVMSVDVPVKLLFIIQNGSDPGVEEALSAIMERKMPNAALFGEIRCERPGKNLGCGPSWNRIITSSPGWWLITGNDIQFLPGALGRLVNTVEEIPGAWIVCGNHYSVFALTELGKEKAGLFDENFYPAYFEDCDHWRRVLMAGEKVHEMPGFDCVHGEAPHWRSSTIFSDPAIEKKNWVTFGNLQEYYVKKWGGPPGKERFVRPFDRDVPLGFWELDPELRAKNSLW